MSKWEWRDFRTDAIVILFFFLLFLQLCVILEPMQELMSRHKAYSLSPRDCLKTTLFQKWQRMVAPPGKQRGTFYINKRIFVYFSSFFLPIAIYIYIDSIYKHHITQFDIKRFSIIFFFHFFFSVSIFLFLFISNLSVPIWSVQMPKGQQTSEENEKVQILVAEQTVRRQCQVKNVRQDQILV